MRMMVKRSSFYIFFAAIKSGFMDGCRKSIGFDGCFLKGICQGQLLVAVAKDENNQIFSIAWIVIGVEKKGYMEMIYENLARIPTT